MALFKHTVNGRFSEETWSFGLHTTGAITPSAAEAAWSNAFDAFWTATGLLYASSVTALETSTAELDQPTGKQLTRVNTVASQVGTAATNCLPFQCAPVVSTNAALAQRAGRGRFYAPSLAVEFVNGSRILAPARSALLDGAEALFTTLTAAGLTGVLYSRTTHNTQEIIRVRVGDVIDTQRRRRNKLVEDYVSANV